VSGGTPFAHAAFADKLGIDYGTLADYNWEAAKAFGLYYENGADMHELVADYKPVNTRGAFLIDTDGTVKYAWVAPEVTVLPEPQPLLDAA
jgi:peroxiredoxin